MGDARPTPEEIELDKVRLQAECDQHEASAMQLVAMVVHHWTDTECPGKELCLGAAAIEIEVALHTNPAAVGNALQGAIAIIARAQMAADKKGV